MADAKSLFEDLKKRIEPKAYRWRKPASPTAVPVPDIEPVDADSTVAPEAAVLDMAGLISSAPVVDAPVADTPADIAALI